jgi:hypothetical protein
MNRSNIYILFLFVFVSTILISTPVLGDGHKEVVAGINFFEILSILVDWIATILEEAAKGVRDSWDYITKIINN